MKIPTSSRQGQPEEATGSSTATRRRLAPLLLSAAVVLGGAATTLDRIETSPTAAVTSDSGVATDPGAAARGRSTSTRPAARIPQADGQCSGRFPLPLASHWTPHAWESQSTTPSWQLERIREGHHWLLTLWWGDFEPWSKRADAYYRAAIEEARSSKRPIAVVSKQWESLLYDRAPWKDLPLERSPLAFDDKGKKTNKLSPLGAVEPWREAGEAWAKAPVLTKLQELYPDPPWVLLLSNNEARRVKQGEFESTLRFRRQPARASGNRDEARRRIMGDGLIAQQSAMVESLRSHLGPWRERALIAGWQGGNVNFGRRHWLGQSNPDFGMTIPGRLNTAPFIWDGIAAKYYIDSMVRRTSDDYTLFSPKVQIMHLNFELEYGCAQNPDYYVELTTWFNDAFVKRLRSLAPDALATRFAGFVRFGMWVTRPRVVRHFSRRKEGLDEIGVFLDEVIKAVDEVHADPVLSSFWQSGELIANPTRRHPYPYDIPPEYQNVPRWLALDTNLDPPKPWRTDTTLPVWAVSLVQDAADGRRWLLFVQAPLGRRTGIEVDVPGLGKVAASATPRGCYFLVENAGESVRSLDGNEAFCRTPRPGGLLSSSSSSSSPPPSPAPTL